MKLEKQKHAIVQLSLDLIDIDEAIETAAVGVEAGVDWLEAGTPLLLAEGLHAVEKLRARFPKHPIVADLKTMDGGYLEAEMMAKAGADYVVVMGRAHEATIRRVIDAGRDFHVKVKGRASHAGVDFEAGASAVLELSRQIGRIAEFTDLKRGITVNPGVIGGGSRSNVVAAEAWADVDIRVLRLRDAPALEKMFKGLKAVDKRCSIEVTGGLNRPPMERSAGIVKLFRTAEKLASGRGASPFLERLRDLRLRRLQGGQQAEHARREDGEADGHAEQTQIGPERIETGDEA